MEDSIRQIYRALRESIPKTRPRLLLFEGRRQRALLVTAAAGGLCLGVVNVAVHLGVSAGASWVRAVAALGLLAAVLAGLTIVAVEVVDSLRKTFDPTRTVLTNLERRHVEAVALADRLSGFERRDLKTVADFLASEVERVRGRAGFLLGGLDKIGIVPAVATLYFAYASFREHTPAIGTLDSFLTAIAAGVVSLYINGVSAHAAVERLAELLRVVERAASDPRPALRPERGTRELPASSAGIRRTPTSIRERLTQRWYRGSPAPARALRTDRTEPARAPTVDDPRTTPGANTGGG